MPALARRLTSIENDGDVLKFVEDVEEHDLVDVYVEHGGDIPDIIYGAKLGHDEPSYDNDHIVEVVDAEGDKNKDYVEHEVENEGDKDKDSVDHEVEDKGDINKNSIDHEVMMRMIKINILLITRLRMRVGTLMRIQ